MPRTTSETNPEELLLLEKELDDRLRRIFQDVDDWDFLDGAHDKRAYLTEYDIDEAGALKIKFHIVGDGWLYDSGLERYTDEDLTRVRVLAKRIRKLKTTHPHQKR